MNIEAIGPLHDFVAQVRGIELNQPLPAHEVREIEAAMDHFGVLLFREQQLDEHQQIAFAQRFGPLEVGLRRIRRGPHRFAYNELADISNVTADGDIAARQHAKIVNNIANQLWHCDSSFQRPRAKYSMLFAAVVPGEGGETEFADLRAAWSSLPEATQRRVAHAQVVHWALHSRLQLGDSGYTEEQRAEFEPVTWPLVMTDSRSGRRVLYVGAHACEVVGMTLPEGRMLLQDLIEHATQRERVWRHQWRVGDLLMWDNTLTAHRGRWFDLSQRREMRRATTQEVAALATQ